MKNTCYTHDMPYSYPKKFFSKHNILLTLITFIIVIVSVCFVDQPLSLYFQSEQLASIQNFSRKITDIGLGEYWFGLALASLLVAFLLKQRSVQNFLLKKSHLSHMPLQKLTEMQKKIYEFAMTLLISLIASGLVVHLFKWSLGRQRPHKSEFADPHVFLGFTNQWHFHSLPSGHSQVLFTVATCIALYQPKYRIPIFTIFALLAFTRVITIQHFLSDVLAGCLIGYLVSNAIYLWRQKRLPNYSE